MNFFITISNALLTTICVLMVLYGLGNLILPLFNVNVSIKIKIYKAKKAL